MLRVRSLGTVPYHEAYALQHALATEAADDYLLILQHPHTYTLGAHADERHVLVDPAAVGAVLERTDRGGDVTYHGPGQLVAYPIVTVPDDPASGPAHVHRLEQVVIATLADLGLSGATSEGDYPGVWLDAGGPHPRKIAAVGIRTVRTGSGAPPYPPRRGAQREPRPGDVRPHCAVRHRRSRRDLAGGRGHRRSLRRGGRRVRGPCHRGVRGRNASIATTSVRGPADLLGTSANAERPLLRRLRQAGVAPEEGLDIGQRKPDWVRVPVRIGKGYRQLGSTVHDLGLVTVCEEAGCPNIYECWADGTATFMINGERCTRACGFCQVDTRHPLPLSPDEPERVAEAVERMRLGHAVITCVARDDLPDGGAGAMAQTIRAIRSRTPETTVEVLISDCRGDAASLDTIFEARPDVLNHNIETVARLQRAVRPSAGYAWSLAVLARAGQAGLVTKSGLMVGLGEREDEVVATMADLRGVGVSIVTIGQYLRPSRDHLPVSRYWAPEEFDRLREAGTALGVAHVEASPLTRSSYHAREAARRPTREPERLRDASATPPR